MKKLILALSLALALTAGAAKAQTTENSQPHGEAVLTLFQHAGIGYNTDAEKWNHAGFEMERAYFGYRYTFNPNWMATVIFDAAESNGTSLEHAFVKNAFVQYRNDKLTVLAGIVPTEQGLAAEKCWGYRYANKAFYDMNGWGASADMGMVVKYRFADWFSADLWMLNGEGFKNLQLDNHYLYALGLNFKPLDNLDIRLYADEKTCDDNQTPQQNLSLFCGYDHPAFRIGAEYNMQFNHAFEADHDMNGFSVFGTYKASPKINIFARYDQGTSSDNDGDPLSWQYGKDGQMALVGMEYRINKLISIAPALRYTVDGNGNNGTIYGYMSAKVAL